MNTRILAAALAVLTLGSALCCKSPQIKVGSLAPQFTALDENNVARSLADYAGKKVALVFLPKAGSPHCTGQSCSIRDGFSALKDAGIVILGMSYDSPGKQKAFKESNHLPFTMLSDKNKAISKAYNVDGWFFPDRVTFLINEQGVVINILKDVDLKHHAEEILQAFLKAE